MYVRPYYNIRVTCSYGCLLGTIQNPFPLLCRVFRCRETTLLERLIKRFAEEDLRVGYYKHDAHRFSIDREGKDTARAAQAGAGIITINDPKHFAIVADNAFKKRSITHALEPVSYTHLTLPTSDLV